MLVKSMAKAAIIRIVVLGALAGLCFTACPNPTEDPVMVENITITAADGVIGEEGYITLNEGAEAELSVTVTPANAGNKTVQWSSTNQEVAAVDDDGKVSALAVGTAVIQAAARDGSGKRASIVVSVITAAP